MYDATMMSIEDEWANIVDEHSNSSMQSEEFSELPLPKLNWETSRDVVFDRSGLKLLVSEVLNSDSNSSFSSVSLKRFRCDSTDSSEPNAKRTKTQCASSCSSILSESESVSESQHNFAGFLKSTNAREMTKCERFNVPPCVNATNGMASRLAKIKLRLVGKSSSSSQSTVTSQCTNACGEWIILTKHQIQNRLRQLWIGKQTAGYLNYIRSISKSSRRK